MYVYTVTSLRSYESADEIYFGAEGLFLTPGEAETYIRKEIADIVSGENKESHELFYGEDDDLAEDVYVDEDSFIIDDHTHCFLWEIDAVNLPSTIMQAAFSAQQHEYDIEDIKNTIQIEDDLLWDHISDIPLSVLDRMAALKRRKEDNGMNWNDAASEAIHEVINQQ